MQTIPYREYSPQETQRQEIAAVQHTESPGASSFSGPSLFDVPDSVEFAVQPGDLLEVRFGYPNDEPAERSLRALSGDGRTLALLGHHTKKILALRMQDASRRLFEGGVHLDTSGMHEWVSALPAEAFNACVRNASVITSIMKALPRDFRRELFRHLRAPSSEEESRTE